MLKRTKGRFLLTVLVITGLAGTIKNTTLTTQERKFALTDLKATKAELVNSVKGLSENQLNFRQANGSSIKESFYHAAASEKRLWQMLDAAMKEQASDHPKNRFEDEEVLRIASEGNYMVVLPPANNTYKNIGEAVTGFKTTRNNHIKYTKSTTEDLRDHFIHLSFGNVDAYQLVLYISAQSNRYIKQINELKTDPHFPKK